MQFFFSGNLFVCHGQKKKKFRSQEQTFYCLSSKVIAKPGTIEAGNRGLDGWAGGSVYWKAEQAVVEMWAGNERRGYPVLQGFLGAQEKMA